MNEQRAAAGGSSAKASTAGHGEGRAAAGGSSAKAGIPGHGESRARDAVEHLQAAAIELIASLRAFLDVAEGLVRDPAAFAAAVRPEPPADDEGGVTRIRVS